jgi:hypothetical protein
VANLFALAAGIAQGTPRAAATMLPLEKQEVRVFVCGCNNATDRPKQPAADNKVKDTKVSGWPKITWSFFQPTKCSTL